MFEGETRLGDERGISHFVRVAGSFFDMSG
jgi:hypothetical protein